MNTEGTLVNPLYGTISGEHLQGLANSTAVDLGGSVSISRGDTTVAACEEVSGDDQLPEINVQDFIEQNEQKPKKKSGYVKRELEADEDMQTLAASIIEEKRLDVFPAKIGYFKVYPNISKTSISTIKTTTKELKFYSGKDYLIEISGEIWDVLDKETRNILLEHQLRHILVLQNDKTGDWAFKLKKHDIQDFSKMLDQYGSDWVNTIKLCTSSLYGLTPREEDAIRV